MQILNLGVRSFAMFSHSVLDASRCEKLECLAENWNDYDAPAAMTDHDYYDISYCCIDSDDMQLQAMLHKCSVKPLQMHQSYFCP